MEVHLLTNQLNTPLRVHPPDPIEVVALVDGTLFRVAIEWPAIDSFFDADRADRDVEATVRDVIQRKHHEIELAVRAKLSATGAPPGRRVVMSREDFRPSGAALPRGAAP